MDARIAPLNEVFRLNSRIYLNCLDGMDSDQAFWRPTDRTNSAGYIALHLVDTRHWMAGMIGLKLSNPMAAFKTEGAKGIDDFRRMPSLDELRSAWKDVTGEIRERLKALVEADLAAPPPWQAPVEDKTMLGLIAFLMQHDSYHIGQMALLRKQVGLEAMSYK